MKCEECKAFSRYSEEGGTCHFTDFGTVMNEDGKNCRSGRIVNSMYRQGRADEYNRIVDIIKSMQDTAQAMAWIEYDVACEKILKAIEKEQKNE